MGRRVVKNHYGGKILNLLEMVWMMVMWTVFVEGKK